MPKIFSKIGTTVAFSVKRLYIKSAILRQTVNNVCWQAGNLWQSTEGNPSSKNSSSCCAV